jgi:hypothetical protein
MRKLLIGTQPTYVTLIRVDSPGQTLQNPEAVGDPQDDLQTDGALTMLYADDGRPGDASTISKLALGQASQLAPRLKVAAQVTERSPDGERRWHISALGHNKVLLIEHYSL